MNDMQLLHATYARPQRTGLIDGVYRNLLRHHPAASAPATGFRRHSFQPSAQHLARAQAAYKRHRFWHKLQLPLALFGCMISGFLIQALWFGIVLVLVYGAVSLILRIKSSITFGLAIMSIVATIAVMIARPQTPLASNFAAYAFLLLTIGVIALTIEVRPQRRKKRRRGR